MRGLVFDFHRGTTHDGPGMRTTVFFKGCPLHCKWCHNPESISPNPELQWTKSKCIGCLTCEKICGQKAIIMNGQGIQIDLEKCTACYDCARNCPAKAIEKLGNLWDVEDLVKEVCKDDMFFEDFGGGITISGGEPLLQYPFLLEFVQRLKDNNQNIALDTSGMAKLKVLEQVFKYVDTFLYDIKLMDETKHKQFTGVSNKVILTNLKQLGRMIRKDPSKKLWIRTPLIPGATATEENLRQIGNFINQNIGDVVERWELCTFNNVCKDKYKKLHREWDYKAIPLMTEQEAKDLEAIAREYLEDKIVLSGLTRKEE